MRTQYSDVAKNQYVELKNSGFFDNIKNGMYFKTIEKNYPILANEVNFIMSKFNIKQRMEAFYWIEHDLESFPECQYKSHKLCTNRPSFEMLTHCYHKGCKYCNSSDPNSREKSIQTCIERYGVKNAMQNKVTVTKRLNAVTEKYGGSGFGSKEISEKCIQTIKDRYKTDNVMKIQSIKDKALKSYFLNDENKKAEFIKKGHETQIKKYGCIYVKSSDWKQKTSDTITNSDRYKNFVERITDELHEYHIQLLEEIEWKKNDYSWKCLKCGKTYTDISKIDLLKFQSGKTYWCSDCYKHSGSSSNAEYEISDWIRHNINLDIKIDHNNRNLFAGINKEIDLYFPDYHLAIEYCGMIYHATKPYGLKYGSGYEPSYHYDKMILCKQHGINLLTVFENEWVIVKHRKIIKRRLLEYFGKYEYECAINNIQDITREQCVQFLDQHAYTSQFIKDDSDYKALLSTNNEIVCVLISVNDNSYIIYKKTGLKITNLSDYLNLNGYSNIITDNRYPISFNFKIPNYIETKQWEYKDGWVKDIYVKIPNSNIKKIRKINDCGYSLVTL